MSSLWELSTDHVVTALIAIAIGGLVVAWLFAGRRRPSKTSELEQRRLEGREAEVADVHVAPTISAVDDFAELLPADEPSPLQTPTETVALDEVTFDTPAPEPTAPETPAPPMETPATADAAHPAEVVQPVEPMVEKAAALSPQQASAMAITAALVRHDKREVEPAAKTAQAAPVAPVGAGGDDLTLIDGVDAKIEKELNSLGVYYFDQIADWGPGHSEWIASKLSTAPTNEQRKGWIEEAKALVGRQSPVARSQAGQA